MGLHPGIFIVSESNMDKSNCLHYRICNVTALLTFCFLCLLEMWYHVFLWALFSSFLVHAVASAIAFCRLRSHKIGRFIPVAILAMGIIWPITAGAVTSMCKFSVTLPLIFISLPNQQIT